MTQKQIAYKLYQPKMRSDTCPRTPLDGEAWAPDAAAGARFCRGWTTAVALDAVPGVPPRRNADAEGASLIGVPTVGVEGSARIGIPLRGATSSTLMRDEGEGPPKTLDAEDEMGSGLAALKSGDWAVLLASEAPSRASACAGSCNGP